MSRRFRISTRAAGAALAVLCLAAGGCGGGGADTNSAAGISTALPDSVEAAAAFIMIAHADCPEPLPGITRTRAEARRRADDLFPKLMQRGSDFAALAAEYSDDPRTRNRGGYFGIFRRGEVKAVLSLPIFSLKPGQISEVIEGARGFFIFKRLPVRRLRAHHLLISWAGARNSAMGLSRTKEQARLLAEEIRRMAVDGDDPCDLAADYSDDAMTRYECGFLGVVQPYDLPAAINDAVFHLRPGKFSPVVESPYGFHVVWID